MKNHTRVEARRFPNIGELKVISSTTMNELHQSYLKSVTRTNELFDNLAATHKDTAKTTMAELRSTMTELPEALAAVKSYELFFSHLGGSTRSPLTAVASQLRTDFGSHDAFLKAFKATALASQGWVALAYDLDLRRLVCLLGDTPEKLSVWNLAPVIVMEVSERSARPEFGQDRSRYIQALLDQLDWGAIERNLDDALGRQPAGKPY